MEAKFAPLQDDMEAKFAPLQDDEVLSVLNPEQKILLSHPIIKFGQLQEALINFIKANVLGNTNTAKIKWLEEGADVEVLRCGSLGWKKGKMRIRVILEFCPDEPENEEIAANNKGESSGTESLLDDIRRMQG